MKDDGESLSESQNPYLGGKSNKTHRRLFTSKKVESNKKTRCSAAGFGLLVTLLGFKPKTS